MQTQDLTTSPQPAASSDDATPAVAGQPLVWLRVEGLAALLAGAAIYVSLGGWLVLLIPLLLAVDVSMVGYVAGPRPGAFLYNLAHNWATGLAVLAVGAWTGAGPLLLAGAILVGHTGMDRVAGYGLKYPTAFADTHLGRLGGGRTRATADAAGATAR